MVARPGGVERRVHPRQCPAERFADRGAFMTLPMSFAIFAASNLAYVVVLRAGLGGVRFKNVFGKGRVGRKTAPLPRGNPPVAAHRGRV